jgi:hypothetical protein
MPRGRPDIANTLRVFGDGPVRDLARLRTLGLKGLPVVEPLGRLVAARDRGRLVVLDYDGRVVASTKPPERPQPTDMVSSSVVANAGGTGVAFTATVGDTAYGSHGHETVYLLAAGERQARPLFSQELDFEGCGRGADLAWRGRWLLQRERKAGRCHRQFAARGADRARRSDRPATGCASRRRLRDRLGAKSLTRGLDKV